MHERKHAVVTGEPGVGKKCVLRALRHALGSDQAFRLTYCHNVTLGRRDFYRHVCHALNIPYGASAGDVFLSLSKHIEDLARERAFPVLLVDEAHLNHQDTLDHLHILLNYAWDSKALLSLVLIGLPDLIGSRSVAIQGPPSRPLVAEPTRQPHLLPLGLFTMPDFGVHDSRFGCSQCPISAFTMADPGVHVPAI